MVLSFKKSFSFCIYSIYFYRYITPAYFTFKSPSSLYKPYKELYMYISIKKERYSLIFQLYISKGLTSSMQLNYLTASINCDSLLLSLLARQ